MRSKPEVLLSFMLLNLNNRIATIVINIMIGASKYSESVSTRTLLKNDKSPIGINILKVTLPNIVPKDKSWSPFIAEDKVTTNSGMLVPIDNVNKAIIVSGIPII